MIENPFIAFYIATYANCPRDRPFPDIPCHEIISIAFLQVDREVKMLSSVREKDKGRTEVDLLAPFISSLAKANVPLVTFQAKRFVLPVLTYRAARYGLVLPQQVWKTKDIAANFSIDDAFENIGLPERPDLNVKRAYEEGNGMGIRRRLEIDVLGLAMVWLRWSISSGSLSVEAYRSIAPEILDGCRERSKKMSRFIEQADKKRLLLSEGNP